MFALQGLFGYPPLPPPESITLSGGEIIIPPFPPQSKPSHRQKNNTTLLNRYKILTKCPAMRDKHPQIGFYKVDMSKPTAANPVTEIAEYISAKRYIGGGGGGCNHRVESSRNVRFFLPGHPLAHKWEPCAACVVRHGKSPPPGGANCTIREVRGPFVRLPLVRVASACNCRYMPCVCARRYRTFSPIIGRRHPLSGGDGLGSPFFFLGISLVAKRKGNS